MLTHFLRQFDPQLLSTLASSLIAFLSDDEVEGLLRAVGPRQAADFLSNIPKERAALLSRRLLIPMPVGASR